MSLSVAINPIEKKYKFPTWLFLYLLILSGFGYGGLIEIIGDIAIGPFFFRPIDIIFFVSVFSFGIYLFRKRSSYLPNSYTMAALLFIYFVVYYLLADKSSIGSVGMITSVLSFVVLYYVGRSSISYKDIYNLDVIAQLGLILFFIIFVSNLIGIYHGSVTILPDTQFYTLRDEIFTRRQGLILQFFPALSLGFNLGALLLHRISLKEKLLRIILIMMFIFSLDISFRGNYLFISGVIILTFFFMKHRGKKIGLIRIFIPSVVSIILLLLFLQEYGRNTLGINNLVQAQFSRVSDLFFALDGQGDLNAASNSRTIIWLYALNLILVDPLKFLFGHGFLLFVEISPLFNVNPHNFIIESILILGLVGFTLLMVFIWLPIIKVATKLEKQIRNIDYADVLIFAVYILQIKFLIALFTQSAFFERDIMIFFYASCGILFSVYNSFILIKHSLETTKVNVKEN